MSGKTTMPKPAPVKPAPVKPAPISPKPIKPVKAEDYKRHTHCVRCNAGLTEGTGIVRQLCSPCDLELQTMHWSVEHKLFNRTTYIPETTAESTEFSPSAEWFVNHGYELKKPPLPKSRSFFKAPPRSAAMTL